MPRGTPEYHLAWLKRLARDRGGVLLSRAYVNDTTKLRFRCAEGHEWMQAPGGVKQHKWCVKCGKARAAAQQKATFVARLRRIVARRGGVILSSEHVNSQTKLGYRCREGHEWGAVPNSIAAGQWCPVCAWALRAVHQEKQKRVVRRRLLGIVKGRGGTILPPGYLAYKTRLNLRCAGGHVWSSPPESIDAGVWCPRCKEESLLAIAGAAAERWGGACLSRTCRTGKEPLTWRCAQGHRFVKTLTAVKSGGSCRACR